MAWKMSNGGRVEAPIEPRWVDAPSIPAVRGYETTVLRDRGDDEVELAVSVSIDADGPDAEALVLGRVERSKTVPDVLSGQTLTLTSTEREVLWVDYQEQLAEDRADARADR